MKLKSNELIVNDGWWLLRKISPSMYSARRKDNRDYRFYYSRSAIERDFSNLIFPDEEQPNKGVE